MSYVYHQAMGDGDPAVLGLQGALNRFSGNTVASESSGLPAVAYTGGVGVGTLNLFKYVQGLSRSAAYPSIGAVKMTGTSVQNAAALTAAASDVSGAVDAIATAMGLPASSAVTVPAAPPVVVPAKTSGGSTQPYVTPTPPPPATPPSFFDNLANMDTTTKVAIAVAGAAALIMLGVIPISKKAAAPKEAS